MNLLEKLQNANLPVISATDEGSVSSSAMTDSQTSIYLAILAEHFGKTDYRIVPSATLVNVGDSAAIDFHGAPNQTISIDAGNGLLNVELDESGKGLDIFTPLAEGEYIIKFHDQSLSGKLVKIQAVS